MITEKKKLKIEEIFFESLSRKPDGVIDGIPRFAKNKLFSQAETKRVFGFEHRLFKNAKFMHFNKKRIKEFLDYVKMPPEYFKGKLVLDAGCGSGRWTYALLELGAKVVAVDLSDGGVEITNSYLKKYPNLVVAQADLMDLPFKKNSFDFILSWGVLHHTPNTYKAFKKLVPLLKTKGYLYIMVYEKNSPLRTFGAEVLRRYLRTMRDEDRYNFCAKLIIKNIKWCHFLSRFFIILDESGLQGAGIDRAEAQFGLYDAYSPRYNYQHTVKEVENWFKANKFNKVVLTSPIINTERRKILKEGQCGGAIHMRGEKRL